MTAPAKDAALLRGALELDDLPNAKLGDDIARFTFAAFIAFLACCVVFVPPDLGVIPVTLVGLFFLLVALTHTSRSGRVLASIAAIAALFSLPQLLAGQPARRADAYNSTNIAALLWIAAPFVGLSIGRRIFVRKPNAFTKLRWDIFRRWFVISFFLGIMLIFVVVVPFFHGFSTFLHVACIVGYLGAVTAVILEDRSIKLGLAQHCIIPDAVLVGDGKGDKSIS